MDNVDKRRVLRNAVKNFEQLVKLHVRAGRTLHKLITHPDASDEMILDACHERRVQAIRTRETGESLIKALLDTPGANYHVGRDFAHEYVRELMKENL